jgi:hypothetical protein
MEKVYQKKGKYRIERIVQRNFQSDGYTVDSVVKLISTLSDEDLNIKPTAEKMSIGELLAHISVLCKADFLIGAGVSERSWTTSTRRQSRKQI